MARAAVQAVLAIVSVAWLSGYGTVENVHGWIGGSPEKKVYGGVSHSVEFGRYALSGLPDHFSIENSVNLVMAAVVGTYCFAVDLPLSAVGDTLTLPITLPVAFEHWKNGRPWTIVRDPEPAVSDASSW